MNAKLIRLFAALLILVYGCGKKSVSTENLVPDEYYTCSMDPQVILYQAGHCPICHMQLIKAKKSSLNFGQLQLSEQQIKLGNILVYTVKNHELSKTINFTGRVSEDQSSTDVISNKAEGRINKLLVKRIGDRVSKGELLYELYSEDLSLAQHEYIASVDDKSPLNFIAKAAKIKLLNLGMTELQIQNLQHSKIVQPTVKICAEKDGIVSDIFVNEGDYIAIGTSIMRLMTLNYVWVEAEIDIRYLSKVAIGNTAFISIPAAGIEKANATVSFINPEVTGQGNFVLARFSLKNSNSELKPGMLANVALALETSNSITLPVSAVIQNSTGSYIWIRNSNGTFETRMIKTGIQTNKDVQVADGVKEGDVVVVEGSYLLNSEFVFKKGFSPMSSHSHQKSGIKTEADPMPGMNM